MKNGLQVTNKYIFFLKTKNFGGGDFGIRKIQRKKWEYEPFLVVFMLKNKREDHGRSFRESIGIT